MRRAFTLSELLVVMLILSILAGLVLVGLSSAVNDARRARTRTIIDKVDGLLAEKWEGYRVRAVPIRLPAGVRPAPEPFTDGNANKTYDVGESFIDTNGNNVYDHGAAWVRLLALRETQRVELPDRISDLCSDSELTDLLADSKLDAVAGNVKLVSLTASPSVTNSYRRLMARCIAGSPPRPWTTEYQGSECLFLILSCMKDGDKSALGYFQTAEIGDTDADGMREILDGWGKPLEWLRWPSGFVRENLAITDQTADIRFPDPFDPLRTDGNTYAVRPLIYSAGLDGEYAVERGVMVYVQPSFPSPLQPNELPNDPYLIPTNSPLLVGTPDTSREGWQDNISNHYHEE